MLDRRPAAAPAPKDLDLEELLKPDNVWECIRDDAETQQALLPLLPAGMQTAADLRELVFSAQYRQTVQTLALVLQNGDAAPLLAEMHLPLDAQGPGNGITRFLTVCSFLLLSHPCPSFVYLTHAHKHRHSYASTATLRNFSFRQRI